MIIKQQDYSWATGRPKILPKPEKFRLLYTTRNNSSSQLQSKQSDSKSQDNISTSRLTSSYKKEMETPNQVVDRSKILRMVNDLRTKSTIKQSTRIVCQSARPAQAYSDSRGESNDKSSSSPLKASNSTKFIRLDAFKVSD